MLPRIRAAQNDMLRARAVRMSAAAVLLLSACSTDNPLSLRPEVDVGEHTASLAADTRDVRIVQPMPDYAADQADMAAAVDAGTSSEDVYASTDSPYASASLSAAGGGAEEPDMAGAATEPASAGTGDGTIRPLSVETAEMAGVTPAGAGVSEHHIDSLDQLSPVASVDPVGQGDTAAQSGTAAPVDKVDRVGKVDRDAPTEPYLVAALPRVDNPVAIRPRNVMPADEVDCRADLKRLGVVYKDLPPIHESEACGIDYPVKVSAIGSVKMVPAATLRCEMAATVAAWTRKELVPAARSRYLTGVKAIHQASSYSCRNIARSRTLSEHGKGNALDIARVELNSGRDIDVRKPGWFSFRQKGFLNSVRSDGCEYFSTVLGPGYNYDHRNHFHFDIKQRRSGHRACR